MFFFVNFSVILCVISATTHAAPFALRFIVILPGELEETVPVKRRPVHVPRSRCRGVGCFGEASRALTRPLRDLGLVDQALGEEHHAANHN
jgi:hypothetical protein